MSRYAETLRAHLKGYARQDEFATKIGRPQGTLSRYATGARYPDAETARKIDTSSGGDVPFALWQSELLERLGIAA